MDIFQLTVYTEGVISGTSRIKDLQEVVSVLKKTLKSKELTGYEKAEIFDKVLVAVNRYPVPASLTSDVNDIHKMYSELASSFDKRNYNGH